MFARRALVCSWAAARAAARARALPRRARTRSQEQAQHPSQCRGQLAAGDRQKGLVHSVNVDVVDLVDPDDEPVAAQQGRHAQQSARQQCPVDELRGGWWWCVCVCSGGGGVEAAGGAAREDEAPPCAHRRVFEQRHGGDRARPQDGAADGVRPQKLPKRLLERHQALRGAGLGVLRRQAAVRAWGVGSRCGRHAPHTQTAQLTSAPAPAAAAAMTTGARCVSPSCRRRWCCSGCSRRAGAGHIAEAGRRSGAAATSPQRGAATATAAAAAAAIGLWWCCCKAAAGRARR